MRHLVDATIEKFGRLDILVNNAGLQFVAPVVEFPEERWDTLIGVMLTGTFLCCKYALPHMIKQKWGRIINVNSIHGKVASPFKVAYVSAKHGVLGLTKVVALEVAENNITCNAICPAYVRTPLVEKQIANQARSSRHFGGGRDSKDHAGTRRHQAAAGTQRGRLAGSVPVYGR